MSQKKTQQLGMNPGTASYRLLKDLLFNFVKDIPCHRCGSELDRESFSIEHKTPWLDSENPVELFFDLENISYSHKSCNSAARRTTKKYFNDEERAEANARSQRKIWHRLSKEEQKRIRREKYVKYGV